MGNPSKDLLEQLAAQIDQRLDRRLGGVERHLDAVGKEVETVSKQTAYLMRQAGVRVSGSDPVDGDDEDAVVQVDQTWQCVKCGSRLGYYDPNEDVLRIRHKDLVFWVQLGVGGKFSAVCRSCGELNSLSWVPPEGADGNG